MKQKEKKEHIILFKLLFTALMVIVYLIGRKIPLYGIDTAAYMYVEPDAESLLEQMIGGDVHRYSVFALGMSPYIMASIMIQVYSNYRRKSPKGRLSTRKTNLLKVGLALIFAIWQAFSRAWELKYVVEGKEYYLTCVIAAIEMIAGVMVVIWISARNKQYGIGGRTALIYVNILEGMMYTFKGKSWETLALPLGICVGVIFIMEFMENTEVRLPLQRISIHNLHSNKDYLAMKLNPVGIMPVMYSSAVFSLFGMMTKGLSNLFPRSEFFFWLKENMVRTQTLGIVVYLGIICFLTIVLSGVFLNLDDVTEQLMKNGDSLLDIHAGKDTKKYLSRKLRQVSCFSSIIMCICVGAPLVLQLRGNIESSMVMLPVSVMMMVGMWNRLYLEASSLRCLEKYHMFI